VSVLCSWVISNINNLSKGIGWRGKLKDMRMKESEGEWLSLPLVLDFFIFYFLFLFLWPPFDFGRSIMSLTWQASKWV
jgi:hypothetical protein